ncbi:hypothetical protein P7C70_g6246, partial [Phenoliferia sp. Uapishka_3]
MADHISPDAEKSSFGDDELKVMPAIEATKAPIATSASIFQKFLATLADSGVESRGLERVREDERVQGGYQTDLHTATMDKGPDLIGDVLSFAGIMFSVSSGWTTIAADYNVNLPVDTPYWRTFWLTFFGTYLPICFTVTMSASFQTISNPDYIAALADNSIGGIVGAILGPAGGFGKFLLVLLSISCVAANVPNTLIWFRRASGTLGPINPDDFNDFNKLPPGYACIGAIAVAIGGIVPSMAETYYTGPIALAVAKPYGGDLGFEFSAVFTFFSYLAFRTLEIRLYNR